ncbi:MAG: hypothetical protein KBD06_02020 [Candidatus Pacebacteria bacterium]|nr:hypothetical protein [Candidatus Paceibacterota bacterium]
MAIAQLDVLVVGMHVPTYVASINKAQSWAQERKIDASIAFFNTNHEGAPRYLRDFDLSIMFVSNEIGESAEAMGHHCDDMLHAMRLRVKRPLIVLDETTLDLVEAFEQDGCQVELRPADGTVEEALKSLAA